MKDWEVLSIIANAAANLRVGSPREEMPTMKEMERFRAAFDFEEQPSSALSPDVFTKQLVDATRQVFLGAFLAGWGLTARSQVQDIAALEMFLTRRYGLRSDDLDHADIFGWSENNASPPRTQTLLGR